MPSSNIFTKVLLSAVTATGVGNVATVPEMRQHTFTLITTAATSGATVKFLVVDFTGVTCVLQTVSSTANASNAYTFAGPFQQVNAQVTAYTDGTHTVNYSGSLGLYSQ